MSMPCLAPMFCPTPMSWSDDMSPVITRTTERNALVGHSDSAVSMLSLLRLPAFRVSCRMMRPSKKVEKRSTRSSNAYSRFIMCGSFVFSMSVPTSFMLSTALISVLRCRQCKAKARQQQSTPCVSTIAAN